MSRIFLADPDDDHAYGGVYLWESRADAGRYLREGLVQILVTYLRYVDLQIRTTPCCRDRHRSPAARSPMLSLSLRPDIAAAIVLPSSATPKEA